MKILHVVGARPNFMKIAPIIREMGRYPESFEQILVHTGQHYDEMMSNIFFEELDLPRPDLNLGVGSGSHSWQTAEVMLRFEPVVIKHHPDWVVVVGDVNSTLACTLVCSKIGVRVAHVEAGLRSFDRNMPEEINRIIADHCSDYLFCPTDNSMENLRKEGLGNKSYYTGDLMLEALLNNKEKIQPHIIPCDFYLATIHRPRNTDKKENLRNIINVLNHTDRPVIFPMHPRTRKKIDRCSCLFYFPDMRSNIV